jgi:phosphate-selective porin OprO and OprP
VTKRYVSFVASSAALVALMGHPPMARAAEEQAAPKPADSQAEKPVEKPPEKQFPPAAGGPDGFFVQSESGDYRLQVRAYAHLDGRFYPGDDRALAIDTFVLRRVRPIVAGTLAKYFDFQIMPDFGVGTTVLQEAYLDFRYSSKARVRIGKFKSPVGLERLQSATNNSFVERAFPTALVPNRDVGVQLHGDLGAGVVSYAVGVFDGAPDGGSVDLDLNDSKDVAGRIFLSPFKRGTSALKELGFGIGGSYGKQSGALPAYRSGGQISILTLAPGITADGTRKRYSPQLSFYSGPFGLMAEYAHSESRLLRASSGQHIDLRVKAWQTTATVTLTGDSASFTGVRARKPFDPPKGQWGAFELAARVNGLELGTEAVRDGLIDPTRSARKAFAWAVGLNWYLNRNVKQVFDYERTTFTGGAASGDRPAENAVFFRTQLSF